MDSQEPSREPMTVPQAVGRLRVALEDAYTQVSRELGLTAQQAELLCAAMAPTAVGDLAVVLRCDRSNVSRLADRAATRGLLYRRDDQHDGRVSVIELTPEGRRLAEQFITTLESRLQPLLTTWPAKRQQGAVETLTAIADTLRETQTPSKHATRRHPTRPHAPDRR